jgi:hypothetical protein
MVEARRGHGECGSEEMKVLLLISNSKLSKLKILALV